MTIDRGRYRARDYMWFAIALIALLLGSAARAADAGPNSGAEQPLVSTAAPKKRSRPSVEALQRRIQLLEERLDAEHRATIAAQTAAAEAERAAVAAQQAAQQAASIAQRIQLAAPATVAVATPPAGAATPPPAAANAWSVPAPQPAVPKQQPVTEQVANTVTTAQPQIFAGPGGFSFQSVDGADQIRFHGEFDFDGRFYDDGLTPEGSRSTWLLRRARPIIEGTFANIFDFRFNPDFAGGKTVIQDAFVAARFNPLFVVTAGKFKEPFGLERLQLSPNNRFIELGLPSDIVPNRDLGLQVSGTYEFASGKVIYQLGWFNGVTDGTSTDANATPDIDNNDDKDWAARVFAQPFSKTDIDALKGVGAGIAVSYVNQVGSSANTLLPTYKTETQRSFFTYAGAVAATNTAPTVGATYADGDRIRLSPQAYYYFRSLGVLGEYVHESQDVARTFGNGAGAFTRRGRVTPESWQLMATYLVTGDAATFGTVTPKRPFALHEPGWGALELAARVSALSLDSEAFAVPKGEGQDWFADPTSQASKAVAWTLGLNWYLTPNVSWYLDYTKTRFDGGAKDHADRDDEAGYFTRFQVAF